MSKARDLLAGELEGLRLATEALFEALRSLPDSDPVIQQEVATALAGFMAAQERLRLAADPPIPRAREHLAWAVES